jgi:hypothetical protein
MFWWCQRRMRDTDDEVHPRGPVKILKGRPLVSGQVALGKSEWRTSPTITDGRSYPGIAIALGRSLFDTEA